MNKRVEQLCSEFDERMNAVGVGWARAEFAKRLAELEGENERLREAFNLYASHDRNDDYMLCECLKHSLLPCTCGYEEAKKSITTDGGEGE